MDYERISKEDGNVSPCSVEQVRRGLENMVYDVELALQDIAAGMEVANNFFIYRRAENQKANGTIARTFIQCADETGRIGDFLATNGKRRVSPTFDNLGDLYTWANENDWLPEGGAHVLRRSRDSVTTVKGRSNPENRKTKRVEP